MTIIGALNQGFGRYSAKKIFRGISSSERKTFVITKEEHIKALEELHTATIAFDKAPQELSQAGDTLLKVPFPELAVFPQPVFSSLKIMLFETLIKQQEMVFYLAKMLSGLEGQIKQMEKQ